jgi:hypothetical protein
MQGKSVIEHGDCSDTVWTIQKSCDLVLVKLIGLEGGRGRRVAYTTFGDFR